MIPILFGFFIGLIQLFLLNFTIKMLLVGNFMKTTLFVSLKLIVWVVFWVGVIMFFKSEIIFAVTAASATLIIGGFTTFIYQWQEQERNKKGKDI